jgi:acetyl-CoA acetyltransferase
LTDRFAVRNKVAIVGYAQSAIERHAAESLGALTVSTARRAISDAGLSVKDVDGFVTIPSFPSLGSHAAEDGVNLVSAHWLAQHLGVVPRYESEVEGGGQLPGSIATAVEAIVTGAADFVLVHRSLGNPRGRYHQNDMREARGPDQWGAPQGFFGPIASVALPYNEYLQRYGGSREAMAAVAVEARKNGARIPWSYWYGKPLTVEEYLANPLIHDPMSRYDCDIPVDGAAAFVFTSAERARGLPHRPVYVSGYTRGMPSRPRTRGHWILDDIMDQGRDSARQLWERTGVRPHEVDLPQVYDGFSPLVYFWLEALGLCPVGEAHRMVQEGGIDSDRPGALPALSGGGALGNGRMHGAPQMLECYLQLSGRAGERQRQKASIALACQGAPNLGGAVLYSASQF